MTGQNLLKLSTSFGFLKSARTLCVIALLSLTACGDQNAFRNSSTPMGKPQPTGASTTVYDPDSRQVVKAGFIAAGSKDGFVELQNSVAANLDQQLSAAIQDVTITPLDENGRVTKATPKSLQVKIKLNSSFSRTTAPAEFLMPLTREGDRLVANRVEQTAPAPDQSAPKNAVALLASVSCKGECRQVELKLERKSNVTTAAKASTSTNTPSTSAGTPTATTPTPPATPQAGLIYTISHPRAEVLRPRDPQPTEDRTLRSIEDRISNGADVTQESFSVVGGASKSRVRIGTQPTGESDFEFETPVVDTADVAPEVGQGRTSMNARTDVRVLGIDPETSDMMVEVAAPAPPAPRGRKAAPAKPAPTIRFSLTNELMNDTTVVAPPGAANPSTRPSGAALAGPVKTPPPPAATSSTEGDEIVVVGTRSTPGKGLFPTSGEEAAPLAQSNRFAHYGKDSFVQALIRSDRNIKQKVGLAHDHAPKVSPYIGRVFESLGLSPEFAYIMLNESNYLLDGKFDALVHTNSDPGGSAFGPWQILNMTASGIRKVSGQPFQYTPIRGVGRNRNTPAADDRGYLLQATYMAASYLKYIMTTYHFEDEPVMTVIGYNRGDGYARNFARTFAARFKNYSIDFATVRKFNMARTDYAHRFLAFREVGQNPEKYGMEPVVQTAPATDIKRLSRKNGPLPPNFFNARIKSL